MPGTYVLLAGMKDAIASQEEAVRPELMRFFDAMASSVMECRSKSLTLMYTVPERYKVKLRDATAKALTDCGMGKFEKTRHGFVIEVSFSDRKINLEVCF